METTETIPEPRRLTRPREGRWLGGVCAGLGEYFELSPTIYRIAFVALALAGGTGILLYIASWLVMPEEASGESIAAAALKEHRDRPARVIGLAVLAFAAIILLSEAHVWPSPGNLWLAAALAGGALVWWQVSRQPAADATAPVRLRNLFPLALSLLLVIAGVVALLDVAAVWNADWRIARGAMAILLGALVAAGAATGRSVGAVAALGLVVLAVLAVALAVRVPVFAGVGDRVVHPVAPSSLRSKYEDGARRVGSRRGHRSGARAAHAGSSPRRSGRTGAAGAGARVSLPLRRVVLVDDHDLFRAGVRGGLGASVEVVGEAGSVADAVPLIRRSIPTSSCSTSTCRTAAVRR